MKIFSITFDFHGAKIPTNIENTGLDFEIALVADSYKGGNGTTVPSDWERWNADVALGWTPDDKYEINLGSFEKTTFL